MRAFWGKEEVTTDSRETEQPQPLPPVAHLDGCTGTGTGAGRLWYMRTMLRISLLGSGRWTVGFELRTMDALPVAGPLPPPELSSLAGSASASFADLVPPCFTGFFTIGGGGGGGDGGDGTGGEERKGDQTPGQRAGGPGPLTHLPHLLCFPPLPPPRPCAPAPAPPPGGFGPWLEASPSSS